MWKLALIDWQRVSEKTIVIYVLVICGGDDKPAPLLLCHLPSMIPSNDERISGEMMKFKTRKSVR